MPDLQVSPPPRSWIKLGMLAVALALVLSAVSIFFWLRSLPSTSAEETSSVQSTLALETFVVNLSGWARVEPLPCLLTVGIPVPGFTVSDLVLCSTPARFPLRRLLEPFLPKIVVLSPLEIPPMVPVQSLGMVR
jgi:hypothetical protein